MSNDLKYDAMRYESLLSELLWLCDALSYMGVCGCGAGQNCLYINGPRRNVTHSTDHFICSEFV